MLILLYNCFYKEKSYNIGMSSIIFSTEVESAFYPVEPTGKSLFTHAEIARRESTLDLTAEPTRSLRRFHALKTVEALFPNNFVDLVGLTQVVVDKSRISIQYARLNFDPDHLTFTHHMKSPTDSHRPQVVCDCTDCRRHAPVHSNPKTLEEMRSKANVMSYAGIIPMGSHENFCIGEAGIMFLDINEFNGTRVRTALEVVQKLRGLNPNQERALVALDRYNKLFDQSFKSSK